jgi:hypothetical protein
VREKRNPGVAPGARVIPVEWSSGDANSRATGPTTPISVARAVDTVNLSSSGAGGQDPPRSASAHCAGEAAPQAKGRVAPFAALPHAIGSDTRLSATARVLALALLSYARDRDRCHPSNAGLAAYVGCSTATVKRALAELEAAGRIRASYGRPSADNPTGRVIALVWREDPATLPEYRPRSAPRVADERPPRLKGEPWRRSVAVENRETPPVGPPEHADRQHAAPGGRPVSGPESSQSLAQRSFHGNRPEGRGANEGSAPPVQRQRPGGERSDPLAEDALVKKLLALGGPAAQQARRAMARRQGDLGSKAPSEPPGVPQERSGAGEGPSAGTFAVALSRLAGGGPAQASGTSGSNVGETVIWDPPAGDPAAMLGRLGPGCDRSAVELAVRTLVRELADPHSQAFYAQVLGDVRAGRLAVEAVAEAYRRAKGRGVRNRGAAFTAAVRSWRI